MTFGVIVDTWAMESFLPARGTWARQSRRVVLALVVLASAGAIAPAGSGRAIAHSGGPYWSESRAAAALDKTGWRGRRSIDAMCAGIGAEHFDGNGMSVYLRFVCGFVTPSTSSPNSFDNVWIELRTLPGGKWLGLPCRKKYDGYGCR